MSSGSFDRLAVFKLDRLAVLDPFSLNAIIDHMPKYDLDQIDDLIEQSSHPAHTFEPDPYHPDQDEYSRRDARIRAAMVSVSRKLKPKAVDAVKLYAKGLNFQQIGEKVGLNPNTVSKHVNSPTGMELLQYIRHYASHLEGASVELRKGFLWRIAVDNEHVKPNVAISAVQEINKMEGSYKNEKSDDKGGLHIVINNELMPRTTLDKQADTYETRQRITVDHD